MSGAYDSHYASNYGYDNSQYQSSYPSSGFSQPQQPYYANSHSTYQPQDQNYASHQVQQQQPYSSSSSSSASYYQSQTPAAGDSYYNQSSQPALNADGTTTDRGLLGAVTGGAAGAFAGHKARGHGVLGALGGAILGSLTEDYAKKGKKNKKNKSHSGGSSSIFDQVSSSMKK